MKKLADALAEEINSKGGKAITISANLADVLSPQILVDETRKALGDISIIVANAAASSATKWNEISTDEWDLVQNVNVRATWLLAKAAYEDLKKPVDQLLPSPLSWLKRGRQENFIIQPRNQRLLE